VEYIGGEKGHLVCSTVDLCIMIHALLYQQTLHDTEDRLSDR